MKRRTKRILVGVAGLLVAALGLTVCAKRRVTRLRLDYGPGEVTASKDIVYVEGSDNAKQRLDVYMPAGQSAVPVVHFVHGGYWVSGGKDYYDFATGLYGSVGIALAKRGVGVVVQSYRLAPDVGIDGILDDVMRAVAWTQQHIGEYGGDPQRIFLMGHSAGGHLVALIGSDDALHTARGMDPKQVRGYVPLSAVWDVADMHDQNDAAFNEDITYPTFGRDRKAYARYSATAHIRGGMQPFLIVIGENDYGYMIPQAERAHSAMTAAGNTTELMKIEGNDHMAMVLRFGSGSDNLTPPVVAFVNSH